MQLSADHTLDTGRTPPGPWCSAGDANCSAGLPDASTPLLLGSVLLRVPTPSALRLELRWGFLLHTYTFACLFFLLAFYAFFSFLNLRSLISSRPFMSTINGFLCLLGLSRAGCLFIDPYDLKESLPKVMASLLWDLGFPCLTSAFCLVQLTFLQLTQSGRLAKHKLCELSHSAAIYVMSPWTHAGDYMLKLGPQKLRKKSCLSLIITAHFSFVIAADVVVALQEQLMVVKYLVETVFLAWGVLLCCLFLYGGYRVMALLRSMPGALLQCESADPQHKGIMQLAMLAPYNNLAGSVAAALMPTILTPKIRTTEENDHSFSYRGDRTSPPPAPADEAGGCTSPGAPLRPGSPDPRRRSWRHAGPSHVPATLSPGGRRPSRRSSDVRRASDAAALADIAEDEATISLVSPTASNLAVKRCARRSLQPVSSESEEDATLLPQSQPDAGNKTSDLTLHSILNHIAYVNKAALESCGEGNSEGDSGSAKSQVRRVLNVTYAAAILGVVLCIANGTGLYGPYGMMAPSVATNITTPGADSELFPEERPRPWPWFLFQTLCRALEFAMGCAMANVTKQPVHSRHAQPYAHALRLKHRESLYI